MTELLTQSGYPPVLALIAASGLHSHVSFAHAVLEGRQPGLVCVNRAGDPRSAIVCNYSGFYLVFGEPDETLVRDTLEALRGKPVDLRISAFFTNAPAWETLLAGIQPEANCMRRKGFAWRPDETHPPRDWRRRIPAGLEPAPLDAALAQSIADGSGTRGYGIDPWFITSWGGPAAYASLNLGLALVETASGSIASLCGVCALGGGEAELEIGTPPQDRGRGLATLVSAAFLEQARAAGWQPAYTCDSENLASLAVARKLGFVEIEEIHGIQLT